MVKYCSIGEYLVEKVCQELAQRQPVPRKVSGYRYVCLCGTLISGRGKVPQQHLLAEANIATTRHSS